MRPTFRRCVLARSSTGYAAGQDFLGQSGNPLFSPLACYLNEQWPGHPFQSEWRIDRLTYQAWYTSDETARYALPAWAEQAERLTDAIQGQPSMRGRRGKPPPCHPGTRKAWD